MAPAPGPLGHDLPVEAEDFLTSLRVERGRAPNTLRAYEADLRRYVAWLDERGLTLGEVEESTIDEFVASLRGVPLATATLKRILVAVRGLHRWMATEQEGVADPSASVAVPRAPRGLPKALSEAEIDLLLDAVNGTDALARRDRAILETLYGAGLRIGELCGLSLGDLDLEGALARVLGKGSKERVVPLGAHARRALEDWLGPQGRPTLEPDRWATRGDAEAVFLNRRGGRLSRQGAWLVVRRAGDAVGLGDRLTPHVLRHSCATHMVDHGADIRTVQELLGHASISTTQIYTAVSTERLHAVYRTAHPRAGAE